MADKTKALNVLYSMYIINKSGGLIYHKVRARLTSARFACPAFYRLPLSQPS